MKIPERNAPCWCGSGRKYKRCHLGFDERLEALHRQGFPIPPQACIKTPAQIEGIRKSASVNTAVLDYVAAHIAPGVSTAEIDGWVQEETRRLGGTPAPLNYEGFSKSCCISADDVVCHGIPSAGELLCAGSIVNVDLSTELDGFFSDASRMFCIGAVPDEKRRLTEVAADCVQAGLAAARPWGFLGDIASAVQLCAERAGFSVVREIGGHGIGLAFHEEPWVGYTAPPHTGMVLAPGLCFTIEPMINMGSPEITVDARDGWTVRTRDGLPSAQWEIQVLITETGCEVLAH